MGCYRASNQQRQHPKNADGQDRGQTTAAASLVTGLLREILEHGLDTHTLGP
jgi:hypothetical protein